MSDLTTLRDHARRLAGSDHRDDCDRIHRIVKVDRWLHSHGLDTTLSCPETAGHDPHEWQHDSGFDWDCPGLCGGCMPEAERALWVQIAEEIDDYLAPTTDDPGLFGSAS